MSETSCLGGRWRTSAGGSGGALTQVSGEGANPGRPGVAGDGTSIFHAVLTSTSKLLHVGRFRLQMFPICPLILYTGSEINASVRFLPVISQSAGVAPAFAVPRGRRSRLSSSLFEIGNKSSAV